MWQKNEAKLVASMHRDEKDFHISHTPKRDSGGANMPENNSGVDFQELQSCNIPVLRVCIQSEQAAQALKKPCGTYITLKTGQLSELVSLEKVCNCLVEQLRPFLAPYFGKALCICGIGNGDLPADALGPETAKRIRPHMYEAMSVQSNFSKIAVICPGVLGYTNLATETIIAGIASEMNAACVLTVDSCVAKESERLCSCIQLSDTGMDSYLGTANLRRSSVGIPVVSIAVPTAIQMNTLVQENGSSDLSLTPAHVSDVIDTAAQIISCAITQTAYPTLDYEDCKQCIGLFAHGLLP